jgi:transposase
VLGDKAYSSAAIRAHLRRRKIKAAISQPADQAQNRLDRGSRPPAFDTIAYKQRNTVERAFCHLRQHRAVATRYDKRDYIWRGTRRPGHHPDLAPPSRPMIYRTGPSRQAMSRAVRVFKRCSEKGDVPPLWVSEGGLEPPRTCCITDSVMYHHSTLTRKSRPGPRSQAT